MTTKIPQNMSFLRIFKPATLLIVIAWGLSVRPAQAGPYVITLQQVGPNVVATGTGAIDLTGLSFNGTAAGITPNVFPSGGSIETGALGSTIDTWNGTIVGPTNFGSGNGGNSYNANSGTGSMAGILFFAPLIAVPSGYVNDSPLSESATYNNTTLSDLGVAPGTYVWSWGPGPDQSVTLDVVVITYAAQIQQPINPDGSSTFSVKRGVVPVKFTLTLNGAATCELPPATISVTRTAGVSPGTVDEMTYLLASDDGSNFRIDSANCQYVYNLATSSLGPGSYTVNILINGNIVGNGTFGLK